MWLLAYFGVQALIAFAFCAAIGRWWALIPPVLFWPVVWLGLKVGWWDAGSGEDADAILSGLAVIGVFVAALGGYLGVAVRKAAR
jgi:hypothetical protein